MTWRRWRRARARRAVARGASHCTRVRRAHPGLKAYVHEPSALAAPLARSGGGRRRGRVPARFGDVGRASGARWRRCSPSGATLRRKRSDSPTATSSSRCFRSRSMMFTAPRDAPDCIGLSVKEHGSRRPRRTTRCSMSALCDAAARRGGPAALRRRSPAWPRPSCSITCSLASTRRQRRRDGCLLSALHSLHALSAEDGRSALPSRACASCRRRRAAALPVGALPPRRL